MNVAQECNSVAKRESASSGLCNV